ncbi:MAG: ABC transporter permease, partial [Acidimicrobiia bacterium]|nr:ABC transporter permease [Acidimicrobiia bacterium]
MSRPKMAATDLGSEALAGLVGRPGRTVLTVLGTVLGIGALVATLGVAQTAGNQIVGAFDELAATSVVVSNQQGFFGDNVRVIIPADAEDRLTRLNGVNAAGSIGPVNIGERLLKSVPIDDPLGQTEFQINVQAATAGVLDAVRGRLVAGRWFDQGHSDRADAVAILGPGAAQKLNIFRVDQQPVVFIGEDAFVVMGLLADVERQPDLLNSVIIPDGTAREMYGYESADTVQIDVAVGAAELIATQAAIAINPDDPETLRVQKPPEPASLRRQVEGDVNSLFLVLGGVSLLVGAIGIANVTLVSVLERVGEIGLRRAVGAGRRHIAYQFLMESTAMGLIGGILGASLGVLVVVAVSASRTWTPVLDPLVPLVA